MEKRKLITMPKSLCKMEIIKKNDCYTEKRIILPELTKDELLKRNERLKALVEIRNELYYLKNLSYEELCNSSMLIEKNKSDRICQKERFEVIDKFPCYHKYVIRKWFKPTVEEILSQYPLKYLYNSDAFYISDYPKNGNELFEQWDIVKAGCHKSEVSILRLKK